MLRLLLLLGALSAAFAENNLFDVPPTPGYRARYGFDSTIGETYYFDIPRFEQDALSKGWRPSKGPAGGPRGFESLKLYCRKEKNFCVLYDDTGFMAGVQYALNQDRYRNAVFDFEAQGFTKWTINRKSYWTIRQYYVTEEFLKTKAADRIASRTKSTLQLDGIWVTTRNQSLLHVPGTAAKMEAAGFVKQKCVQGQGLHYLYKPQEIKCTSETWMPWIPIVYNNTLTGCIMGGLGEMPAVEGERNWYEVTTPRAFKASLPDIPDCLVDLAEKNGVMAMHTFFFGLHYMYKPQEIKYTAETWMPWVPIVYNNTQTGCILVEIGKMPAVEGERNWYEEGKPQSFKAGLPDLPDCMVDLAESSGLMSIHTFYFGNPWTITRAARAEANYRHSIYCQ